MGCTRAMYGGVSSSLCPAASSSCFSAHPPPPTKQTHTPPPLCTPTPEQELFWAHAKNYLASKFENGRKMAQAIEEIRAAWYGWAGDKGKADCDSLINHAIKEANLVIADFARVDPAEGAALPTLAGSISVSSPKRGAVKAVNGGKALSPDVMLDMGDNHGIASAAMQEDEDTAEAEPGQITPGDIAAANGW